MIKKNYLQEKLAAGKTVIGTFAVIPSPITADIIASADFDFIVIDGEHGPINFETAQQMVIAAESRNISPAMRVSGVNESEILKALDIGAHCLHIPNITTKNDIQLAISYAKYPPIGKRGFSPFTRAGGYSPQNVTQITQLANKNTLLAVHIEGKDAFENIDSILRMKELDIVFVGLFDLSKSLGIPGQVDNPKVLELLKKIADTANRRGKIPGTIATNQAQLERCIKYGVRYITYSVDCDIIRASFLKISANFRTLQ
jgi:4-hydroxy-2-oxoheptanedioate aldolase